MWLFLYGKRIPLPHTFLSCSVAVLWMLAFIFIAIYAEFCIRQVAVMDIDASHTVYVQYGNVFSDSVICNPKERRNIVIPVNRCFDTLVDDDLISATTLHGKAMQQLYKKKYYTPSSLNFAIQQSLLINDCYVEEVVSRYEKRSGNLKRFPVGSVAEISCSSVCMFFFLALSTFDVKLKANTTMEDYCLALVRLLHFLDERAQGYPIVIPLIGTHLSRANISPHDSLEYLLTLLRVNKGLLHSDVHVIVSDKLKEKVTISNFVKE